MPNGPAPGRTCQRPDSLPPASRISSSARSWGLSYPGEGEHVFLYLQKRNLNSMELLQRLAALSGVPERDIGVSGLSDRNAVTRQWFSIGRRARGA